MSMSDLIQKFSFGHCSKSGAKFDYEKGKWFNHKYLQELPDRELAEMFKPILAENGVDLSQYADEYIARVVSMVKGRINFVKDLWEQSKFFFVAPAEYEEKSVKKRWKEDSPAMMNELVGVLSGINDFSSASAEAVVMAWITEKGYHMGNIMNAFRLTVVGECKGPHMFDITELIGKEETINRVRSGILNIAK